MNVYLVGSVTEHFSIFLSELQTLFSMRDYEYIQHFLNARITMLRNRQTPPQQ